MDPMASRDALIRRSTAGSPLSMLFFWKPEPAAEPPGAECLSQWYPSGFVHDETRYLTAEHWMMHQKALLFDDVAMAAKILREPSPARVQILGRGIGAYVQSTWIEHRVDIVTRGNLLKFQQSPELRRYLLDTAEAVLVEASPQDRIWSIGLAADDPHACDPRLWRGENLLGFALMRVRSLLRAGIE